MYLHTIFYRYSFFPSSRSFASTCLISPAFSLVVIRVASLVSTTTISLKPTVAISFSPPSITHPLVLTATTLPLITLLLSSFFLILPTASHERRFHQQMKKLSKIRLSPSDSFFLSHISLPVPVFRIASSLFKICFSSSSPKKRPTGSPLSLKPCMVTSVPV